MASRFIGREQLVPADLGGALPPADSQFTSLWPALWEYLTLSEWDDGAPRDPSTLLLFVNEGRWRGCLNDKANGRTGWRSAETMVGLLDALEAALAAGSMDWRRPREQRGRSKR